MREKPPPRLTLAPQEGCRTSYDKGLQYPLPPGGLTGPIDSAALREEPSRQRQATPARGGPQQPGTVNPAGEESSRWGAPGRGRAANLGVPWAPPGCPSAISSVPMEPSAGLGEEDAEQNRETPLSAGCLWSTKAHTRQIKEPDKHRC